MLMRNRLSDMHAEMTAWRRDFHMHPKLLYDTQSTTDIVADKPCAFGCDAVMTGPGCTDIVGLIRGRTIASHKTVGLRAAMHALQVFQATGVDYAATVPREIHACSHDGPTAMLLAAASYVKETPKVDGTVASVPVGAFDWVEQRLPA